MFVKFAAEIAHFQMENEIGQICSNFKVGFGADKFQYVGFYHYDKTLELLLASEYNQKIFCPENKLPQIVVGQLLLLTFSFAVRLQLSGVLAYYRALINYKYIDDEWQIQTLLSAYKNLSAKFDITEHW
ncbi:hypothetical protein niasHS_001265 [Heterodera schachtii]|uniref:Uncharacterized protein n=1 Tax=Heterodera schachtii TaxID=97005 RepID=A0ABD2KIM9_HETSC